MRVGPRRHHPSRPPTPAMAAAAAHAPPGRRGVLLVLLAAALVAAMPATCAAARSRKSYRAVFSFGDSLSDAGNLIVNGTPKALTTARPPYGMTFFRKPTGRCSNGRLVVDFLGTVLCTCFCCAHPWPSISPVQHQRLFFFLFVFRDYFLPSTYYMCGLRSI